MAAHLETPKFEMIVTIYRHVEIPPNKCISNILTTLWMTTFTGNIYIHTQSFLPIFWYIQAVDWTVPSFPCYLLTLNGLVEAYPTVCQLKSFVT